MLQSQAPVGKVSVASISVNLRDVHVRGISLGLKEGGMTWPETPRVRHPQQMTKHS
jgi:hypothetical protein